MDLVRRLPKAALVTFVAFLFFGGTLGMVMAAGQGGLPTEFGIAAPREGDQFVYESKLLVDGLPEDEAEEELFFEWLASDVVYDRNGMPRHVQPLVEHHNDVVQYVDQATLHPWASARTYSVDSTQGNTAVGLSGRTVIASPTQETANEYTFIEYTGVSLPCGTLSDLQGAMVSTADPVLVHGDCLGALEGQGATLFEAVAAETWQGRTILRYEAFGEVGNTKIWFDPALPYPVRIVRETVVDPGELQNHVSTFVNHEAHLVFDAELIGFEPGQSEWGVPNGELPPALPKVETTPIGLIGPDDSGIDFRFRLSDAFESARTDPTFPFLRDFLAEHEDAQTIYADFFDQADEGSGQEEDNWMFVVWAEGGFEQIVTSRTFAIPPDGSEPIPVADRHTRYNIPGIEPEGFKVHIPETVPTVASAFANFEAATGTKANGYGFDYGERTWCPQCSTHALAVDRFHSEVSGADPITGQGGTRTTEASGFRFDDEGKLLAQRITKTWSETNLGTLQPVPEPASENKDAPEKETGPRWIAPSPQAAAGMGFMALVVGGLYWLWPSIKALPMLAGFTRVRSEVMLENPARAEVYAAIKREPGLHYQGLVRAVGKGASVVDHHLRKLEQGGFIVVQKGQGFTCFFPQGEVDHRIMVAVPALKTEGASRVLKEVVAHPGLSITSVAEQLGVAKSTVSYHVGRLRKAHLLEAGRALMPTKEAEQALVYAA